MRRRREASVCNLTLRRLFSCRKGKKSKRKRKVLEAKNSFVDNIMIFKKIFKQINQGLERERKRAESIEKMKKLKRQQQWLDIGAKRFNLNRDEIVIKKLGLSGGNLAKDQTFLCYDGGFLSNLGSRFKVPVRDIETVTVDTKDSLISFLRIMGKGTELAKAVMPHEKAEEAQEWILKNLKRKKEVK